MIHDDIDYLSIYIYEIRSIINSFGIANNTINKFIIKRNTIG